MHPRRALKQSRVGWRRRTPMTLRGFHPGFGLLGLVGFLLFAAGLGAVLVRDRESDFRVTIALAVFAVGMAVLGGASWVVKTVLEGGVRLQEGVREARARANCTPPPRTAREQPPHSRAG